LTYPTTPRFPADAAAIVTKRVTVFEEVESGARSDVLETLLPDLKGLLDALRTADIADVKWDCVSSNPAADYESLIRRAWEGLLK